MSKPMLGFIGSVEFYVIAAFVAAAVIAAAARPSRRSAARTFFFAGTLLQEDVAPEYEGAGIFCTVNDRGDMLITRSGLEDFYADGAYSLAVEIIGTDVTINERLTAGHNQSEPIRAARATLDCLAPERYHFHYISHATKTDAAFYLTVRPGARTWQALKA